jgi:hypothetical protein
MHQHLNSMNVGRLDTEQSIVKDVEEACRSRDVSVDVGIPPNKLVHFASHVEYIRPFATLSMESPFGPISG